MAEGTTIAPFTESGRFIGVNFTDAAWQVLYTGAPVYLWKFRDGKITIDGSPDIINGYPYIGIRDGKVIATVLRELAEEWTIQVVSEQVFVIRLAKEPNRGWTLGPFEPGKNQEILIELLPGELLPTQKFVLRPAL